MSSADTSYMLTKKLDPLEDITVPVYKYLDIDSTYRNRNDYSNPNDFVVFINYPGRNSESSTAVDVVIDAVPFTASTKTVGNNVLQAGSTTTTIVLDTAETVIDNYYINNILEINGEFRTITSYNGATKNAIVSVAYSLAPVAGTVYYTRKKTPFFVGTVAASPIPTFQTLALNSLASTINNIYVNSYVRFTSGLNSGTIYRIISYDGSTKEIRISGYFPNLPVAGDNLELDSYTRDNASTLLFSTAGGSTSAITYYEIELKWIIVPNQLFKIGNGGTYDRYPYIYVRLYNEGNRLSNQVMYSNNPNSTLALFKVPIDNYYGNTSFFTFKGNDMRQVIRFDTASNIRFSITIPDGTIIQYSLNDALSPLEPNPLLQINALFAMRKV